MFVLVVDWILLLLFRRFLLSALSSSSSRSLRRRNTLIWEELWWKSFHVNLRHGCKIVKFHIVGIDRPRHVVFFLDFFVRCFQHANSNGLRHAFRFRLFCCMIVILLPDGRGRFSKGLLVSKAMWIHYMLHIACFNPQSWSFLCFAPQHLEGRFGRERTRNVVNPHHDLSDTELARDQTCIRNMSNDNCIQMAMLGQSEPQQSIHGR
mmetsp:Transcript_29869/g.71785  ORF Transcript_29869/g.71785 Transcript_29869/m.71785 type:complete len:207 (-) Transcript_29869:3101-3721(-)